MSKGFSRLEISALIICASIATHGMANDKHVTLRHVISSSRQVANITGNLVDSTRYLHEVNQGLARVNGASDI